MSPGFIKMGLGGTGFLGKPSKHKRSARRFAQRRKVLPGFPVERPFESIAEVREYLSGDRITCLLCGKSYRTLGLHLLKIHGVSADEYRGRYGIPWSYGLACKENREAHSKATRQRMAEGFTPGNDDPEFLAMMARAEKRKCPHKEEISTETILKYNESRPPSPPRPKSPPRPRKRRPAKAKFGSPEHREKMRRHALKYAEESGKRLGDYWRGRRQSDEHKAKRRAAQEAYLIRTGKKKPPRVRVELLPCRMCGADVSQPAAGRKLYCSTACRSRYYREKKHAQEAECGLCGGVFVATYAQSRRVARGLPVYCGIQCRQSANGRRKQKGNP